MRRTRVVVRRERPTVAAWSVALLVTMLVVYVLTLNTAAPNAVQSVSAMPRVTRQIEFEALAWQCVSMGAFGDAAQARIEAAGCVNAGAAGFVVEIDGAWHVLGAIYEEVRDARRAADRLADEGYRAEVLPLEADRVILRITAPERQIDAILAANAALRQQLLSLGTMARQLDRGELQPDGAQTLCAVAASEASDAREALYLLSGAADNALCNALIGCMDALVGQLNGIAASAQAAPEALSGMLRLAQIDTFLRLRELQRGLLEDGA